MANLKVKILKKSKDSPYPEHIIVERKSTHEMVHLYFDDGLLKKFTHIKRDPQIRMAWDEKEKKYKALLPNYLVVQEAVREEDRGDDYIRYHYLKGPENQNFFTFYSTPPWNLSTIAFQSDSDTHSEFYVEMDLNRKCVANAYIGPLSSADIAEIYPHKERRTCPSLKNFKEYVRN